MKHCVKYLNILIFLALLGLFFVVAPYNKLSTNLISLLPQNEETKLLKVYENFQSSREILVAIKSENIKDIKNLEKRVLQNSFIKLKKNFFTNKEYREYIKKYQFYLQNFDAKNLENIEVKLQKSYENILLNPYYNAIDKNDPLELFSNRKINTPIEFKNAHYYLKDYGYMSIFTFENGVEFQKVYNVFEKELKADVKVFSPIFYFVQNEKIIKSQVNFLVFIALSILILLYVVILKNIFLLFNTILTLLSASILALLVVTSVYGEVSIFVMVFGMAISTIAIDYMFHNYFCGFYEKKSGFNRAVFYGFLSTFIAFFIISFVDFAFIKQVSFYACISLGYSYIVFTFLFPKIGFTCKEITQKIPHLSLLKNYKYFVFILLAVIVYSSLHVKMDLNIKSLDYDNVKLKKLENFFTNKLQNKDTIPFIIKAKTLESLIDKSVEFRALHVDAIVPLSNLISKKEYDKKHKLFSEIDFLHVKEKISTHAQGIGFRKGFFQKSYPEILLSPQKPNIDEKSIRKYGFDVEFDGEFYYSFGFVKKGEVADGVYLVSSASLFQKSLKLVYKELFVCGFIIVLSILFILLRVSRENFFKALSFILFPIALILFIISLGDVNILQIFMLFVVVSLSIDYGIYMSEKKVDENSQRAIVFSLMSTFAGFGVLIFSTIGVLFYIGQVATLGLLAIFILLVIGNKNE
ncbi:hypothetical protein [Sulfurospirillum arcachonense]|uniref:hypothetical protein n=1 Tax=Sulfurospirillum arcachonense TaxID=57666 RepID=UPI0004680E3A|nr:hypothetical protein [Sulfurospirillum arcachonense]